MSKSKQGAPVERPRKGGSYVRQSDGSLRRSRAAAPAAPAPETKPDMTGEQEG